MKKIIMIAGALVVTLVGTPAKAHNSEMCNYNLDYDLTIEKSTITFEHDSGKIITIDQDNHLLVNGNKRSLNDQQQQLLDNYADGVRDLIPEVTSLAIEGVNLGVKAASLALGSLLGGEGDADFDRFINKISELANSITMQLNTNSFSSKQLERAFEDDFEEKIEAVVEEAISELTPRLMAKIVTAAMSGGGDEISDLEATTEALEEDIESLIEPQAKALEARADELCVSVEQLNVLETKMVASGLEMMDLIGQDGNRHHKKKSKKFNFNFSD